MHVSATRAKNQFGAMCLQAKTAPVFIEKDGRVETVILSAQQYERLCAPQGASTLADRRLVFENTYKDWLADEVTRVETNGVWCDDLRVW